MAPIVGYQAKLGIGTANPVTIGLDMRSETMSSVREIFDFGGARGTRSHSLSRVRLGPLIPQGSITLFPTPVELVSLLPWILGGTPSGNVYPLAEQLSSRYVAIDLVNKVPVFSGVYVSRATFSAAGNTQPLQLQLDLLATGRTVGASGTFPSLTIDGGRFFMLQDAGQSTGGFITVDGSDICTENIVVTIDNVVTFAPFTNCSDGPEAVMSTDRIVTVSALPGYGGHDIYPLDDSGVPVQVKFVYDSKSLLFDFVSVVFREDTPTVTAPRELVKLPLLGTAYQVGSTKELVTTLVSS